MIIILDLAAGIAGMALVLLAFVMEEFYASWNHDTVRYNFVNILGSGLLVYYAFTLSSILFMILNGVWFLAALYKLTMIGFKKKKKIR